MPDSKKRNTEGRGLTQKEKNEILEAVDITEDDEDYVEEYGEEELGENEFTENQEHSQN